MKQMITLITILFISLLSSPSWSKTLTIDDLVKREDLYYKKFTDIPFTGKVTGLENGTFRKGNRNGEWLTFYENGQLKFKRNYKYGKPVGLWEQYHSNGQLKKRGIYKDGKPDGFWIGYYSNGQLWVKQNYKDGKSVGLHETYRENGLLWNKFNFTDEGREEERYYENGQLNQKSILKDGILFHEFYYENGQLQHKGNIIEDGTRRDGLWIFYNEDGTIYRTKEYRNFDLIFKSIKK